MTSPNADGSAHRPIWFDTAPETDYGSLSGDMKADTAVVGGGIVGLSVAFELTEAGQSVVLLERDRIAEGVTGHTTAKLTAQHGLVYNYLLETFGREKARQYAEANQTAIEEVESRIEQLDLDCSFERTAACVYTQKSFEADNYEREADVATSLGLPATYVEALPERLSAEAGVQFDDQALFHPREYLLGLGEHVVDAGNSILEETKVTDVETGSPCVLTTDRGTVRADDVVLATHFPIHDNAFYFARVYPKQSYVLAVRLNEEPPERMYYRPSEPYLSVRPRPASDESTVLVGGQNHRTGHGGDTEQRYRRLEEQARAHFDVASVTHRWSTQDYVSIDRVPYVGKHSPLSDHLYLATGFGGWGLTNGVAAARLLSDLVLGRGNPFSDVYHPTRGPHASSLPSLVSHGATAARHTISDHLGSESDPEQTHLGRDEATIVEGDDDLVAVYRDPAGDLHAVSAVCTHQGCHVHWNDAERTWDCPCHGSRFDVDGHVVDTPAVDDLEPLDPPANVEDQ